MVMESLTCSWLEKDTTIGEQAQPWTSSTQSGVGNASKPVIVCSCIYCPKEDLKSPDIFNEQ